MTNEEEQQALVTKISDQIQNDVNAGMIRVAIRQFLDDTVDGVAEKDYAYFDDKDEVSDYVYDLLDEVAYELVRRFIQ